MLECIRATCTERLVQGFLPVAFSARTHGGAAGDLNATTVYITCRGSDPSRICTATTFTDMLIYMLTCDNWWCSAWFVQRHKHAVCAKSVYSALLVQSQIFVM